MTLNRTFDEVLAGLSKRICGSSGGGVHEGRTSAGILSPTYCFTQRSALSNCDGITLFNTECRADVGSEIRMSLFVSGVFGDEVQVFAADD